MTTQTFSFPVSMTGPSTTTRFTTKRTGIDRTSAPVTISAIHYDEANKAIRVFGSDGNLRTCLVSRLASIEDGRALWTRLQSAGKAHTEVQFVAAGGFSPDRWFYDITTA
jgi:hypothetical protein